VRALEKIREIAGILRINSILNAEKQAQEIVSHVLKIDRIKLFTENPILDENHIETIDSFVSRRIKREPLEYILGECDFYNIKIKVGQGVLIPRPETEIIVEEFKKKHPFYQRIKVLFLIFALVLVVLLYQ